MSQTLQARLERLSQSVSQQLKERAKASSREPSHQNGKLSRGNCWKCCAPLKSASDRWGLCSSCRADKCRARFSEVCPTEYADTDIERLPAEQWAKVSAWQCSGRGLLLLGPTRAGKTRCAWMLIERLADHGKMVTAFSPIGFGLELVDAQMNGQGAKFIDRVSSCPLVFFDDLGKAKLTENVEACLFEVIERRTSWRLPTIATTNDTGETLKARMTANRGKPLVERLREFFDVIKFPDVLANKKGTP